MGGADPVPIIVRMEQGLLQGLSEPVPVEAEMLVMVSARTRATVAAR